MPKIDSCGALIKQLHDTLEKNANNAMRPQGLTMAQIGVLLALYDTPEHQRPLKEIEKILRVAQSTAAGIVSRLEQKGFTTGYTDKKDRRIKMVKITESGIGCCKEAEKNMAQAEASLLSGLTEEEKKTLIGLLIKVRDSQQ
jgi:DNA-binding MarR family transcriptional regulator